MRSVISEMYSATSEKWRIYAAIVRERCSNRRHLYPRGRAYVSSTRDNDTGRCRAVVKYRREKFMEVRWMRVVSFYLSFSQLSYLCLLWYRLAIFIVYNGHTYSTIEKSRERARLGFSRVIVVGLRLRRVPVNHCRCRHRPMRDRMNRTPCPIVHYERVRCIDLRPCLPACGVTSRRFVPLPPLRPEFATLEVEFSQRDRCAWRLHISHILLLHIQWINRYRVIKFLFIRILLSYNV